MAARHSPKRRIIGTPELKASSESSQGNHSRGGGATAGRRREMSRSIVLALVLVGSPAWVAAQGVDSLPEAATPAEAPAPHVLRWWQGVAAAGALSTLMVLDHPVQRYARRNSGSGADNVAA